MVGCLDLIELIAVRRASAERGGFSFVGPGKAGLPRMRTLSLPAVVFVSCAAGLATSLVGSDQPAAPSGASATSDAASASRPMRSK